MGFSFYVIHAFTHPSHTLSTTYTSRTHVKAPQTDFHIKPDNSSGPTNDNPPKKPLRMKVTFRHGKATKSIEESHGSAKP